MRGGNARPSHLRPQFGHEPPADPQVSPLWKHFDVGEHHLVLGVPRRPQQIGAQLAHDGSVGPLRHQ
jgi:hypothetical protein